MRVGRPVALLPLQRAETYTDAKDRGLDYTPTGQFGFSPVVWTLVLATGIAVFRYCMFA